MLEQNADGALPQEAAAPVTERPRLADLPWISIGASLLLLFLYIPVLAESARLWTSDDSYSHCVFIIPITLGLLWIQRAELKAARPKPTALGLIPLCLGLLLETGSYLLQIKFLATVSLVPVIAGAILLLHGRELWSKCRFAVLYLLFAAPVPGILLAPPSNWIQHMSSNGSSKIMQLVGIPLIQNGNRIEIPGIVLEVADVCSGFKKLVALIAFSVLYGYLFDVPLWKRYALVAIAIPIAVFANVARVSGLIAVASWGGIKALHIAHDWAELFVLAVAFVLFVFAAKVIGCKTLKFSL